MDTVAMPARRAAILRDRMKSFEYQQTTTSFSATILTIVTIAGIGVAFRPQISPGESREYTILSRVSVFPSDRLSHTPARPWQERPRCRPDRDPGGARGGSHTCAGAPRSRETTVSAPVRARDPARPPHCLQPPNRLTLS